MNQETLDQYAQIVANMQAKVRQKVDAVKKPATDGESTYAYDVDTTPQPQPPTPQPPTPQQPEPQPQDDDDEDEDVAVDEADNLIRDLEEELTETRADLEMAKGELRRVLDEFSSLKKAYEADGVFGNSVPDRLWRKGYEVVEYSQYSFAVFCRDDDKGVDKLYADLLPVGSFNRRLKYGGVKRPGFIFSNKRRKQVEQILLNK